MGMEDTETNELDLGCGLSGHRWINGFQWNYAINTKGDVFQWKLVRDSMRLVEVGKSFTGYHSFVILTDSYGNSKPYCVAAVELETFVGPRPTPHHFPLYRDGDSHNLKLSNLYWSDQVPM